MTAEQTTETTTGTPTSMRAAHREKYGSPEVVQVSNVPVPVPGESGVLVRVKAAGVNPYDFHMLRGSPPVVRVIAGLLRPKAKVLGIDFAGVVVSTGPGASGYSEGDEVYGFAGGTFAEYATTVPNRIAPKPAGLSFEEAAGVPTAAITAIQGLRDRGGLRAGQKVLVNGASGGVGSFAVQIAKAYGAEVTGVCSTRNLELLTSLGTDHVIDYTKEDFARQDERYDLFFDAVGNRSLGDCKRVLAPDGTYVAVAGSVRRSLWMSIRRDAHAVSMLASPGSEDLVALNALFDDGTMIVPVDRTYALEKTVEAIRYVETERARGKVIITL